MKLYSKNILKLIASFVILLNVVFVLQSTVNATNAQKELPRYVEKVDNTEYEEKDVVDHFMALLSCYDKKSFPLFAYPFAVGFNNIMGYRLYRNTKGDVVQDIRSIATFSKYAVAVNRSLNQVTVYGFDENEKVYNTPVVSFICTCNKTRTKLGKFYIKERYRWRQMLTGTWAQYTIRFTGNLLFHSLVYNSPKVTDLDVSIYNQLGDEGESDGCIRLKADDAYWLYKNLQEHALVVIYDHSANNEPFDRPLPIKITDEKMTFDPTDPSITGKW